MEFDTEDPSLVLFLLYKLREATPKMRILVHPNFALKWPPEDPPKKSFRNRQENNIAYVD